jgi:1-acyl-sn-glycerol-3-phosphate acyltransferase
MPEAEPITELPKVRRDRVTAVVIGAAVCLAMPTVALLVMENVQYDGLRSTIAWLAGSALVAMVIPLLYWCPYRALGLIPFAAIAWLAAVAHGVYWHEWPGWAHGALLGLIVGALARERRGQQQWWEMLVFGGAVLVGVWVAWMIREAGRPYATAEWFALVVAIALLVWSWRRMYRPATEITLEPVLWIMYRVRRVGPGHDAFPRTGPCIVIANHACWLDPIFLAKVISRPITPMMTSRFYDLPVIRWFMVGFGVIRVPEKALKKDAAEIQEAIAALDRGECVVIFPEGYLRRKEDVLLRRFGQGIWQILKARPSTPVFATWIEGAWGSYTSYCNGAPTKNKKKDFRRPIDASMSVAAIVPPEVLEEHLRTRLHLMNLVSEARKHVGLEPLPPFALAEKEDEPEVPASESEPGASATG